MGRHSHLNVITLQTGSRAVRHLLVVPINLEFSFNVIHPCAPLSIAACPFFVTSTLLVAESRNNDLGWLDEYGAYRLLATNDVFKHFYSFLISEIKSVIHMETAQNMIKNGGLDT
jgi:hypothetical protein